MIRLFTAVGTYKLEESGIPVILAGGRECALDTHELLLWSSLAFRILTYQEAKAEFYAKERELHILSELDFDHYLNRLTMRRLIASGRDEVGVDALYDLLGHLYIEKTPSGLPAKTAAFLNLWLRKRMPFRKALAVFHTKKPEATEKKLLSLLDQCAIVASYRAVFYTEYFGNGSHSFWIKSRSQYERNGFAF